MSMAQSSNLKLGGLREGSVYLELVLVVEASGVASVADDERVSVEVHPPLTPPVHAQANINPRI